VNIFDQISLFNLMLTSDAILVSAQSGRSL